jgi:NodT family efflux transporter outer membrane factor (OMF) lipoprotein
MSVGPDYVKIEPQAPERWQADLRGGVMESETGPVDLSAWWSVLQDPQLSSLEARAVAGNLNLKAATARIREARALRGVSSAGFFPTVDTSAAVSRRRSSANSGAGGVSELYSTGFDADWELDLFGGIRRSVEAAEASLEATEEEHYALQVSLLAEVALNYVALRSFQTRLDVNRENVLAQQESYELNASRYQAGLIDELVVQESLRILESTRALSPALEGEINAAKNSLAVLLGEQPGSLHAELAAHQPLPGLPISVVVGIPAETLRRRPDVRRAERNLAAQTARIGVATADLYPKFRLFGSVGLESLSAGDLFKGTSKTWGFGPSVSWNLFDAGRLRRNIDVQTARQEQALLEYELTVLRAQEEVENALFSYAQEQLRRDSVRKASQAAIRAEELARDRYQAGLVDFSNVLDAQRAKLLLRDESARSDGIVIANLVRLYKALGGGWSPMTASQK